MCAISSLSSIVWPTFHVHSCIPIGAPPKTNKNTHHPNLPPKPCSLSSLSSSLSSLIFSLSLSLQTSEWRNRTPLSTSTVGRCLKAHAVFEEALGCAIHHLRRPGLGRQPRLRGAGAASRAESGEAAEVPQNPTECKEG